MRHQKGFTLIEISAVVVIVGILAVTAVPTYQEYIARSQITEAFNIASSYLQNKKIQMAMTSKSGGATWTCYSSDIQQRFLPRACNGI